MKLRLDATPDELRDKGGALIKALAGYLREHNPELAESLDKALRKEPALKYRLLRDLHTKSADLYEHHAEQMISDIEHVLNGGTPKVLRKADVKVEKSTVFYRLSPAVEVECSKCRFYALHGTDQCSRVDGIILPNMTCSLFEAPLAKADGQTLEEMLADAGILTFRKAQNKTTEGDVDQDPDYDPESGEPIFDPKTGLSPSEKQEAKDAGELDEDKPEETAEKSVSHMHDHVAVGDDDDDDDDKKPSVPDDDSIDDDDEPPDAESVDKAMVPASAKRTPVRGFKDHTQAVAQKDDRLYQTAKRAAMDWDTTLTDVDFDNVGGRFYGWSTNQVVDWVREQRKQ